MNFSKKHRCFAFYPILECSIVNITQLNKNIGISRYFQIFNELFITNTKLNIKCSLWSFICTESVGHAAKKFCKLFLFLLISQKKCRNKKKW